MCITNLETKQDDHAELMGKFALDAMRLAAETPIDLDDLEKGTVQLRAGFHSGPVVAHVVGTRYVLIS